jgi:hypothetical protein
MANLRPSYLRLPNGLYRGIVVCYPRTRYGVPYVVAECIARCYGQGSAVADAAALCDRIHMQACGVRHA